MVECPINNSPVEILIRIWSDLVLSVNVRDCFTSFNLASVCRHWRSILLTTPQLWTNIHLRKSRLSSDAKALKNHSRRLQLVLKRNPHAPLKLTVDYVDPRHVSPLAMVLVSQLDRITHLKIDGDEWPEFCRELISIATEPSYQAPSLTHLEIDGADQFVCYVDSLDPLSTERTLIASNLTHFKIHSRFRCELEYLEASTHLRYFELHAGWLLRMQLCYLAKFHELESITLLVDEREDREHLYEIPPLPSLRHLIANAFYFLQFLTKSAPNIQHLELIPFASRKHHKAIARYLEFTVPNRITELKIHISGRDRILWFPKLEKLLAISPMIEHLAIIYHPEANSPSQFDANSLLRILLKRDICPRLRCLELTKIKYELAVWKRIEEKMAGNVGSTDLIQTSIVGRDIVKHEILTLQPSSLNFQTTENAMEI